MAKLAIKKASTDVTVYLFIQASNVTTGAGLTGLTFETANLVASYVRPGAARAAITLATLAAADSAHSDGGFKEVDATNMPGIYRLDLPDAVCATGVNSVVVMLKGAANMAPVVLEVQLVSYDPNDAVRLGITALPNAAADAAGGLPISDAGALDLDAQIKTDIDALITGVTVSAIGTDVVTAAAVKADAVTKIQNGLATPTNITAGTITTTTNLTNLPTMPTDWITAAGLKADAVTKIQSGLATTTGLSGVALSAAGVDAILDEVVVGTYTMRQLLKLFGAKLHGTATGGGTTTITYAGMDETAGVIVETVDTSGNRSEVKLTV